jgi:hypothetical protein
MKGLSSKILILVSLIVLFVLLGSLVYASEVTIKAGTPIPVKLLDDFYRTKRYSGESYYSIKKETNNK